VSSYVHVMVDVPIVRIFICE